MKISIVILHFGNLKTTQLCIQSLYRVEAYPFSLIVVNNTNESYTSKDFSRKRIAVINNRKNLGFAGGVNVGIRFAIKQKADFVCLLNNDTLIKKPILSPMLLVLKDEKVGIVGPAIEFKKNNKKLFDVGGKMHTPFFRTSHDEVEKLY